MGAVVVASWGSKKGCVFLTAHCSWKQVTYKPDFRQAIADSWPKSLDDSRARRDWGWSPKYDLAAMTTDMLAKLKPKLIQGAK